jgi:hypothetical protein
VVAEAGTGKSRLFYEFKTTLPAGYKVLEAYSVSHGRATAWSPVLELLRGYFGILDADDPTARREKIRSALEVLAPALSAVLPYLFALLGIQEVSDPLAQMDPHIKQRRALDAIKRVLIGESLRQPTIAIFEDLHWIDSQTQALLDLLADSIVNTRVLLRLNYRPEYSHEWGNKSHYSQVRLDSLDPESAAQMLEALLSTSLAHPVAGERRHRPAFVRFKSDSSTIAAGPFSGCRLPQTAVVDGDALSASLAAASTVAKVTRDSVMEEYAELYPEYGFEGHKGYGTADHIRAQIRLGPLPLHRWSFAPVWRAGRLRAQLELWRTSREDYKMSTSLGGGKIRLKGGVQ